MPTSQQALPFQFCWRAFKRARSDYSDFFTHQLNKYLHSEKSHQTPLIAIPGGSRRAFLLYKMILPMVGEQYPALLSFI